MTIAEIRAFCLSFPGVCEDYPFDELPGTGSTPVFRHRQSGKIFALLITHGEHVYLNLKCDPLEADILRREFKGLIPGYHMNKVHWNSIIIGSDVPAHEIRRQIENSYDLTARKRPRRRAADSGTGPESQVPQ